MEPVVGLDRLCVVWCLACVRLQAIGGSLYARATKNFISDSTEVNHVNGQITIRTVRFYLSDVRLVQTARLFGNELRTSLTYVIPGKMCWYYRTGSV